jgi:RNA polymerase sigma factor (sigma-70 family)
MEMNSPNRIDKALLESAKRGDQKAYGMLMDKYRNSIYHLILKIIKSPEDAEDLTIETFAKAFDRLHQFSPEYAFSTWLYKIASNTCIDFIRKKSIEKVSLENEHLTITDNIKYSTSSDPETELIKAQRTDQLQQAVNEMDELFARVITLRYFKEYSYEEMSKELGTPVSTIKVQLYRAKKILLNKILKHKDSW